jgi:hypothetical protein
MIGCAAVGGRPAPGRLPPSDKPGYFDNCLHDSPPIPITPEAEKVTRAYLARLRALPSDPSVKRVIAHTMRDLQAGKHLQASAARH